MSSRQNASSTEQVSSEEMAMNGLKLFINNRSEEAKQLFREHMDDSIHMSAGYAFVVFMDALMSFEEDKLQEAFTVLNETEKKCQNDSTWLKSMKTRVAGDKKNIAAMLEAQTILGDTQACIATLTFLQQDFSSYLKGAWVLRKAWRIYKNTYVQLHDIYKKQIGELVLPHPLDFSWDIETSNPSTSTGNQPESSTSDNNDTNSFKSSSLNGYKHPDPKFPHSYSTHSISKPKTTSKQHNNVNIPQSHSTFSFLTPISTQLNYLTDSLSTLSLLDLNQESTSLDTETLVKLLSGISFGYGIIQLGISLLPPALVKVTNFLGFSANRVNGISHLMFSRKGAYCRSPVATLALLWYNTILRPFYAIDGTNIQAGVEASFLLLSEVEEEYSDSALFLFFRGRTHRLNSDITKALEAFNKAVEYTTQREIKLLTLHEICWCYLIQLNFENAVRTLQILKNGSRWSRHFYTYLLIICLGSQNKLNDYLLIKELSQLLKACKIKTGQIEMYLNKRLRIFPEEKQLANKDAGFWRLLVYEILFLWNSLPTINMESNITIISDCNTISQEPYPGLAMLVQGECYTIRNEINESIKSYRKCIALRDPNTSNKDDVHISAYCEFALGLQLIKQPDTFNEGKSLIEHSGIYKDYDFDSKHQMRIESTLKQL